MVNTTQMTRKAGYFQELHLYLSKANSATIVTAKNHAHKILINKMEPKLVKDS